MKRLHHPPEGPLKVSIIEPTQEPTNTSLSDLIEALDQDSRVALAVKMLGEDKVFSMWVRADASLDEILQSDIGREIILNTSPGGASWFRVSVV